MLKYKFKFMKHGFTIIELIVIMAVMAILVFLGSLGYKEYTKQARFTRLQYDARLLSDACQRFYVDNGDYPRLTDTPYTADQVNAFSSKVYNYKGAVISIDSSGNYYDLDFSKLKKYVSVNEDYKNFILQNPVGDIYFLEPSSNTRLPGNASLKPAAPTLMVDTSNNPPAYNITYPNSIVPQETDYQLDGGEIVASAPVELLTTGNHNINVRYKYKNQYSDWVSADFTIANGVKQISAGLGHTIALMQDGTIKVWGLNNYGQLGIATNSGTATPNPNPTTVPGITGVKQVDAGNNFTVILMQDGTVKTWGLNQSGQLGVTNNCGNSNPNPTPTTVPGLTTVKQISAGDSHTAVLMQDGTVRTWGYNKYGELGTLATSGTNTPSPIPATISGLTGVKQIATGSFHTIALMEDGTVKAWGQNNYGQLGITTNSGTTTANPIPTLISGLTDVAQLSAGVGHTAALMQDGNVYTWGQNYYGQLGITINIGTTNSNQIPTIVPGLTGVKQIEAGGFHTAALLKDGTVKTWGWNYYGQLGIDTSCGTTDPNSTPTSISGLVGVSQIASGYSHTLAIMQDGIVKAWGYNLYGQSGLSNSGTAAPNPIPIAVSGF